MESKRTLHSGNLVRGFYVGDRKLFILLKDVEEEKGQEIFDLKFLTKEEVAWLEEHFIDFAREQYLVRWDDMREALKIAQC